MKPSPLTVFLTVLVILTFVLGLYANFTPPSAPLPPQEFFSNVQKATNSTENVFFGPFSENLTPYEVKLFLNVMENLSSTGWASYTMPLNGLSGPLDLSQSHNMSGISGVTYTDLAQDEIISDGDYITITFGHSGSGSLQYQVGMIRLENGNVIDSITFYW